MIFMARMIGTRNAGIEDVDLFGGPIVDNVTLDPDRANALAELGSNAAHARLVDEQLESVEEGVNKPIGGRRAGILGDVGPDLLLGKRGQPIRHLPRLGATRLRTTARL